MKDSFEASLLSSGDIMRKGYAHLAENAGKAIAAITMTVTALVLFTEISFADITSKGFTSTAAVMLLASFIMYFSMHEAGERLGESSDEHKTAMKAYDAVRETVRGDAVEELRKFCDSYSLAELSYRRGAILLEEGCSEEEYRLYLSGEGNLTRRKRRALARVKRQRAIKIDPRTLLAKVRTREESELKNPESGKLIRMLISLIPCTLSMLLTVSVMLTVKSDMNAASIIDGILKLSGLPVIGFKGYSAGYTYTRKKVPIWIETKTRLLEAFIKKRESAKL